MPCRGLGPLRLGRLGVDGFPAQKRLIELRALQGGL